ncbi:glycosyl transferase [Bradyrhizobium guangzhouense]|uniref:Glycosyl transferase n=1 Tax=Bradyrhizobium guangzhouense TaxID=1325095 RepID=A0AAE5WZI1_9BRAD|nr:glycosyl transferase [Bradyrhizobium guangzhouense]QAU45930.1 glycosyl transferase [Bradyrhizobium guangzhouense]
MAKRVYCTYFDHNYIARGLALFHSLQQHAPGSRLWVLCLSEPCYRALIALNLPNLVPCRLGDFEAADPQVAATKPTRSTIEYYFTCSPAWKLHVLANEPDAEWVTYLDSDLFFFASPEPIYDEMKGASFGIIPHHFTRRIAFRQRFGTYNVGWVSVRNCEEGIAALRWWRERCIEWCFDYVDVEGDRFADQRYLDRLPRLFPNVRIIENLGANLAPWNMAEREMEWRDGALLIDSKYNLLFFHFHGVQRVGDYYFNSHRVFRAPFPSIMRAHVYEPYVAALAAAEAKVAPMLAGDRVEIVRNWAVGSRVDHLLNIFRRLRTVVLRWLDVVTRRAIAVPREPAR